MTTQEIANRLSALVKEERRITQEILDLINTALGQRAYLELGYPSMFEWLTKGFGYSHSAAYRRIEAAKLLRAVPEVASKLETGEINLSVLAKAQSVFRAEEKAGRPLGPEQKLDVVESLEKKSLQQAEQVLTTAFPGTPKAESQRAVTEDIIRLSVNLERKAAENLKRVGEILSHHCPGATDGELIAYALNFLLEKKEPLRKAPAAAATGCVAQERRQVIQTADATCEYVSPITGNVCGSRFQIQIDHIIPRALGGTDAPSNLRCLCRQHNMLEAEVILGESVVGPYWEKEKAEPFAS